jgi:putative FmdB family regulatory protein
MPFYEYQCSACDHHTEVLQKISDAPLRKCPHCGKSALKRLISAPVFRLKGSGWYETDFKSDSEKKRNLVGEEASESKSDSKADASTDSAAPAKAAEAKPDAKSTEAKPAEKKPDPAASKSASKNKPTAKPTPKSASRPAKAKPPLRKKAATRR